jgi:hypothetical protein
MATITVETKNGPVLVDEDQISAWGGEIIDAPATDAPKRKTKPVAPVATDIAPAPIEGKFMLVDQDRKQFGDELFDSADAALEAMN